MYHFCDTSHNQKLIIIIYINAKIAHTGGSFMEKMNFLPKSNDLKEKRMTATLFHVPPTISRRVGKSFSNLAFSFWICSICLGIRSNALRKLVAAALWRIIYS